MTPNPMSKSRPPDFAISEKYSSEDGGMYVVVYAVCAISGGIVGLHWIAGRLMARKALTFLCAAVSLAMVIATSFHVTP